MAKATKTTSSKATKAAAKPTGKKAAAPRVVRSAAVTQAQQQANPETALYQVLQPFWLNGATVKPKHTDGAPVFIEMSAAEAREYQEAGVLGDEPAEVPDTNETHDDDGGTPPGGGDVAQPTAGTTTPSTTQ